MKLKTAWEKLAALLLSQRFITTVVGIVVIAVLVVNIVGAAWNPDFDPLDVPDEVALTEYVTDMLQTVVTAISSIFAVAWMIINLVTGYSERPPTLSEDWAANSRYMPTEHQLCQMQRGAERPSDDPPDA